MLRAALNELYSSVVRLWLKLKPTSGSVQVETEARCGGSSRQRAERGEPNT